MAESMGGTRRTSRWVVGVAAALVAVGAAIAGAVVLLGGGSAAKAFAAEINSTININHVDGCQETDYLEDGRKTFECVFRDQDLLPVSALYTLGDDRRPVETSHYRDELGNDGDLVELEDAHAGSPYVHLLARPRNNDAVTWNLVTKGCSECSVPGGLKLTTTGMLLGTPERSGAYRMLIETRFGSVIQAHHYLLRVI